jgi:hypothetical protein
MPGTLIALDIAIRTGVAEGIPGGGVPDSYNGRT